MRKLKLFLRKNSVSNWYSFCWLATSFYVIVLAIFIILPGKARLLARTELPIAFIIFNTFSKYCFFQLCIPELYKCDYSDMIYFTKRGLKIDWIMIDWKPIWPPFRKIFLQYKVVCLVLLKMNVEKTKLFLSHIEITIHIFILGLLPTTVLHQFVLYRPKMEYA